ncbi:polyprenyl synthetase family protein [Corallococcus praedator]|uniref:Polyprenyl synthetase family protein n=1 Tax=Corallococcus praedator TaxID=2316724 RepID=A0ABX9QDT9_9BACT|nr:MULTISPECIES: farnesyl diphosphate synthase [Corallococcus]RKH36238.1 polyprenyl synthetase family protein [Corallococcus sp. CA031C]RKI03065.1 polyprenyl synthetase family protein [Corallococcus praedator]
MAAFELEPFMRSHQARVEELLRERADRLVPAGTPARLAESMRYSLLAGGKRLRPVMCLAFADAVARASTRNEVAVDAACALEYVHTYSLVHDDLPSMDNDDLRRGKPTNHKMFGESLALLAGDGLLTEAFTVMASGPEPVRGLLCAELARAAGAAGMVGGQVLDTAEDRAATEAYLIRLHRMKTGALIRAACRMGVLAGGGDLAALVSAETYGDAVGLAFQIADDVLDVTASAEQLGKPAGADAEAGRFTFPAVLGLEASRRRARELVATAEAAVRPLEGADGPLAALARYSVERTS